VDLSADIARVIARLSARQARVLVGVDGPDAAGKSTLADQVAEHLEIPWLRASIDGFHQPREVRSSHGSLSSAGYFHDSFNYSQLMGELLRPFAAGAPLVRSRVFDWRTDTPVEQAPTPVPERAALVFDGVFLLRSELRDFWDYSVYLRVASQIVLERAIMRDAGEVGSSDEVRRRYEARYLPGQALYRDECDPERHADLVVDNSDFSSPIIVRRSTDGS
jgi:uridine kinase